MPKGSELSRVPCTIPCKNNCGIHCLEDVLRTKINHLQSTRSDVLWVYYSDFGWKVDKDSGNCKSKSIFLLEVLAAGWVRALQSEKGGGEWSTEKAPVTAPSSSTSAGAASTVISERLVVNLMARNELFPNSVLH